MFHKRKQETRKKSFKLGKLDELVLSNTKLKFSIEQLQNLNYIIHKRLQRNVSLESEKSLSFAKSVSERLVQRLICGAGIIDPRFSTKYLICNNRQKINNHLSHKLDYIVRLDCLSLPSFYESDTKPKYSVFESESEYPAGYARIKLHTSTYKIWGDFTNSQGFLRRDKIQAKLVELLALAASKEVPSSPLYIDESIHCGIPGKVVDPFTLHNILKIPPDQQVYYGPGGSVPRFPDPRDFRLAIVDEPNGIRIKVEFLSPSLSNITVDVTILVAVGIDCWPVSTDFPSRLSLGHSDCLLYHQAALTGMYLVGYGVHSSAWQIRLPAAEYVILSHYGNNSTVKTILEMLHLVLEDIDESKKSLGKHQLSYKILTKYILQTVLFEELEENSTSPVNDMINWAPIYLSTYVLKLLDNLVGKLSAEKQPNYFFKKSNLMVNPGHLTDDDYIEEANYVKTAVARFFDESLMSTKGNEEFNSIVQAQESEMVLLFKWRDLIEGLLPPSGTRGRRFCFAGSKNRREIAHSQYTARQLEYIGMLLNKMLMVRQKIIQFDHTMEDLVNSQKYQQDRPLEDIIFILVTIMDQARDRYLTTATNPAIIKNSLKIKSNFNNQTSKLVDVMRRDKDLQGLSTVEDDLCLVKIILKWLYRGMDQSKRYLGPILRPYLNNIFSSSHAMSWHLESLKERLNDEELNALGIFAQLVNSAKITPAQGLIDSVSKNWEWARSMLSMIEQNTLRIIFVSDRGQIYRHILSLPSYQRKISLQCGSKTLDTKTEKRELRRQKTLPSRSYFNTILNEKSQKAGEEATPQHDQLKQASPLTYLINKKHRMGEHRGCGDIFKALTWMQKLRVFQEVASDLPPEERLEILELIQSIQTSKRRRSAAKRWSETLPQSNRNTLPTNDKDVEQKYTMKEESAGISISTEAKDKRKEPVRKTSVLLESCRIARIKEDFGVFYLNDSFRIKSLLSKSDSFKY
ncbi:unnamed protein product [Phyllotreta striolata]|uniref:Mab-21-like HhH/H2TH-like domain-containing protein n=1 Tax=Phyllotreta striolata TaxID=444603 RepID=A0A9N9TMY1_PHYSR|nr:unnamed protein product [Phyllotreta striolata]